MSNENPIGEPKQTSTAPALISIASRDHATAQQVSVLLSVAHSMLSSMGQISQLENSEKLAEARIAAETTFTNACERLDKMIAEAGRWDDAFMRRVEKSLQETHDANMATHIAQKKAVEECTTPHFQYRPAVARLKSGNWIAYLGNLSNPESCITGVGPNPQAAIEAFDGMFKGIISPYMQAYLAARLNEVGGYVAPAEETEQPIEEQEPEEPGEPENPNQAS